MTVTALVKRSFILLTLAAFLLTAIHLLPSPPRVYMRYPSQDVALSAFLFGSSRSGEPVAASERKPFRILNITRFNYTLFSDVCSPSPLDFLVFVHSAPKRVSNRARLRGTLFNRSALASLGISLRVVFLFGVTTNRTHGGGRLARKLEERVEAESRQYGDVVQGSFIDTYRNLSYKYVMGLDYVVNYCGGSPPRAKYVLKTDDDVFINIFKLFEDLESGSLRLSPSPALYCVVWEGNMPVLRDPKSKWYVSKEEHANDFFEYYCSGSSVVTTLPACRLIVGASLSVERFLWVDDVFVSGTLANRANVSHVQWARHYSFRDERDTLRQWADDIDHMGHHLTRNGSGTLTAAPTAPATITKYYYPKKIFYVGSVGDWVAIWRALVVVRRRRWQLLAASATAAANVTVRDN